MDSFYEFILELSAIQVIVMCGAKNIPDLWGIHQGGKMYLSTVVMLEPWPETKYS